MHEGAGATREREHKPPDAGINASLLVDLIYIVVNVDR
jgi:hypothetical protein